MYWLIKHNLKLTHFLVEREREREQEKATVFESGVRRIGENVATFFTPHEPTMMNETVIGGGEKVHSRITI